ncbi:STAS/SEC14 domain-containing protein [Methanofollis aquaemaris]|uniref:STAS/SEC14 domain-containing protein n=1 Tax=Methanofollis aquaemaris TaxID=126734 RepID=A0A8A3S1Z1_9EURY|nr:STAS/SEC14 domain-containing protein [Methanofollis aquaemaris]QSZ66245.1 STAS/SEC14 domain-containing protein [Methanofollis aquaemaris]
MIEKLDQSEGKVVGYRVSGRLTAADYDRIFADAGGVIGEYGAIRMLCDMEEFQGVELAALWEDFEFGIKYGRSVERLAIVGDAAWEKWIARLAVPLYAHEGRYFPESERDAAWVWLREGTG